MIIPGAGRYCAECGDWFDFIEGNEGREWCSSDCEVRVTYCGVGEHTWRHEAPYSVACEDCEVIGRICVEYPL